MKKYFSKIVIVSGIITVIIITRCSNDETPETSSEIVVPNIIKTESQLRDEAYRADPILWQYQNLR